jgi:hypothetical protein
LRSLLSPVIFKVTQAHLLPLRSAARKANPSRGEDAKPKYLFYREVAGLPDREGRGLGRSQRERRKRGYILCRYLARRSGRALRGVWGVRVGRRSTAAGCAKRAHPRRGHAGLIRSDSFHRHGQGKEG